LFCCTERGNSQYKFKKGGGKLLVISVEKEGFCKQEEGRQFLVEEEDIL